MDIKRIEKDTVIRRVASEAQKGRVRAYLVGGMVRNLVLGVPAPPDYDFVIEADPEAFSRRVSGLMKGSSFPLDEENGVWRVVAKKKYKTVTIDFSVLKEGMMITDDLAKRDFSINAMAVPLDDLGSILDPMGGIKDAGDRLIRAASENVFTSDPLRSLRAFRLSGQYGLGIEKATLALILESAPLLASVAAERIREELVMVFASDAPSVIIRGLYQAGLMQIIMPETAIWHDVKGYDLLSHALKTVSEAEKILRSVDECGFPFHEKLRGHFSRSVGTVKRPVFFKMTAFLHDTGKPVVITVEEGRPRFIGHDFEGSRIIKDAMMRLRFSKKFSTELSLMVRNHHRVFILAGLGERTGRTKGHFFRAAGDSLGVDLLLLALADARATRGGEDPELFNIVKEMLEFYYSVYTLKKPKPLLTGDEVMRIFKVSQGPVVGRILKKLSEGLEAGVIRDKKGAVAFVRDWLSTTDKKPL